MSLEKFWVAIIGLLWFHIFVVCGTPKYTFLHEAKSAPLVSYYDYIIVGGGTTGCPLATTLSQGTRVLLLERGGSPYDNPNITHIDAFSDVLHDTSPTSPSQSFISEDGVINARARVLGGGSCINAGFYTRADTDFVRNAGLNEHLLNESYQWVEKKVAFKPILKEWQTTVGDALLEVGVLPYNGFTYDHLNGTKIGGVIYDKDGYRHTAADLLEYADPSRLTVLLHASVMKILFRTKGNSRPKASGVVFRDASGTKHKAYLKSGSKNEIILSAGAIGSPQLLMLSGVGPGKHLNSHNIKVVLDQPLVGQGMSDNSMNLIAIPSPIPVGFSSVQVVGITRVGSYIEAISGKNFFSERLQKIKVEVPSKGRTLKAFAKTIQGIKKDDDKSIRLGFIGSKIIGPLSSGHLELRNRNPDDNPSVTFNYFKEPKDLKRCVSGMKIIEKIIKSKSFSKFKYEEHSFSTLLNMTASMSLNLRPKHDNTSTSIEQYCKDVVMTIWHYHGGCQIGKVVDHDYRVLGLDSLRVIDGSTFTFSPGTNPQATIMMLGRYMAVKILKERFGNGTEVAGSGGGGSTLSELYQNLKRLLLKIHDELERLDHLEYMSFVCYFFALFVCANLKHQRDHTSL